MFNNKWMSGEDTDFMPIVPLLDDKEEDFDYNTIDHELPVLVLKNTVLYPQTIVPITVSREKSLLSLNEASNKGNHILVFTQKDVNEEDPSASGLYEVGTLAQVVRQFKMPDGGHTVLLRGRRRATIDQVIQENPFISVNYHLLEEEWPTEDSEFDAMLDSMKDLAKEIVEMSPNIPNEASTIFQNVSNNGFLMNFIASNISLDLADKVKLLKESDIKTRLELLLTYMQTEKQFAELRSKIDSKTRADLDKQQREYFLQQQMKSIKDELGGDGNEREIRDLQKRAENVQFSAEAREAFEKGIQKLERMHPSTPDYSVVYNHLDLILDLPWEKYTNDTFDLSKASKILDSEHYGMEKIKDRILEYLAVLKLKGDMKSPILCFVGPPGIGKTSLGKSIATAIDRKYARVSFGGLHDESEIRGHRKTYIGAMPGRIIQSIRKVQSSNPVFILDEVDKLGSDFRGDPSSALLEVLDPEQNHSFYDNYLEMEYDLSKVLFIATANDISKIQPALRDRLEIIYLNGYSTEEKIEIAKKHLVPKQKEAHGLKSYKINLKPDVLKLLIQDYTMESGVRELDRQIASLMRVIAKDVAMNDDITVDPTVENLSDFLGKPKYTNDIYQSDNPPGVAVGLAWTYVGGEILFIEAALSEGTPGMTLTGNLGNVMKESATTAFTFLKSRASQLGITKEQMDTQHLHIHVPEGATPKDGPSAGITMLTAMASAYTGRQVKPYLAMTGEITLRGRVLPVGGIKEKILAAKRAGLKEIMLCVDNKRDIEEINAKFLKGLKFIYVRTMDEVLDQALTKKK